MALFTKTVDIWSLSPEEIAKLQPGQYVQAGPQGPKGRFFGHGASTVVAWSARIPAGSRRNGYLAKYAQFGREVRNKGKAA